VGHMNYAEDAEDQKLNPWQTGHKPNQTRAHSKFVGQKRMSSPLKNALSLGVRPQSIE